MASCAQVVPCTVGGIACEGDAYVLRPDPAPPESCTGVVLYTSEDHQEISADALPRLSVADATEIGGAMFVALAVVWAIKKLLNSTIEDET